jgi:hypothetical protein
MSDQQTGQEKYYIKSNGGSYLTGFVEDGPPIWSSAKDDALEFGLQEAADTVKKIIKMGFLAVIEVEPYVTYIALEENKWLPRE